MWETIPQEIYLQIIHFINEPKQIKQCRLVCKYWNHPDLKYIQQLSRIVINNKNSVSFVYDFMERHPTKGRFVKHIILGDSFDWNRTFLNLMDLIFTPNLEVFKGILTYNEDHFYYKISNIIKSSPKKTWNLKVVPDNQYFSYLYFKTLLLLKDSLEDITLNFHNYNRDSPPDKGRIARHMDQFTRLKKLSLMGSFRIKELRDILQACPHLEELYLEAEGLRSFIFDPCSSDYTDLKKMTSLRTLKIGRYAPASVMEYLICIYPNVETVESDGRWCYPLYNEVIFTTLKAIEKVPIYKVKYMLDDNITPLGDIVKSIKAIRHDVSVEHFINAIDAEEIIITSNL
ncbi:hypothetical protein V8B55DRAFT_1465228 [Mucor lusitanicus]|uniref:F-box domain-containing protein n=2 Tax=Mucor circinelloides f. lusitanicus TaxID=29924 RepID=A0A168JL46_MUCCL|nr:hypothetical protein FB192DRAFT_1355471 [Mucor lusitanicus]OAD01335.1 hypothetical protein MUCCIDRAFT_112777 [Mucor lusitanicus CBS 277.49]